MRNGRLKFILGGAFVLAAIGYLIYSSMQKNTEFFMTVNELQAEGQNVAGRKLRVSGAVVGDTIRYDPQTLTLSFEIAHVPGDNAAVEAEGGLAAALHAAVLDPARARLTVIYHGDRPDLLRDEAQAIVTGHLGEDGVFYADELLLKCPTRYEEALPQQAEGN